MSKKSRDVFVDNIPYKKGDILEIDIIDLGNEGEGIGKTGAFIWFIKDAIIGDKIKALVMKVKKNYGYARLVDIIDSGKDRLEAPCNISRSCGGCQIQNMSYSSQIRFKENKVYNALMRIGDFDLSRVLIDKAIGMENPWRYRNKALFPIRVDKNGELIAGFFARRTHSIIKVTDCLLGIEENKDILDKILIYMKRYNISAYDEIEHKGLVRHVLIRKGFKTDDIMICIVINGDKLPFVEKLIEELKSVDNIKSISLSINKEKTNVVMGRQIINIFGDGYITDYIDDIKFRISPLSFYQVNPIQTKKLYKKAIEYAELRGDEIVWDLYCGIGTISLLLSENAKKVYGIEIIGQAIEDAKENARINNITNAEFFVGKAEEVLPELYNADIEKYKADVVVVDPPRKGCDKACLDTILEMKPERIVYVSCECSTLARDLKYLCESGEYELKKVCVVDQFPHTVHVETVACIHVKVPEQ